MKRATVIIGANYGDEGKGKMTDFIASQISGAKTVVRFNGGAQAGHTVVTPEGKRHVFHHFGSGSFAGARTYLAKHFVCNPILFWHEYRQFSDLAGLNPLVAADPRCFITTPYDMLINQIVEDARDDARHGSCGIGFGETIERNNFPGFRLWKDDLQRHDDLPRKLRNIRDHWMPARLVRLGVRGPNKDDARLSNKMLDTFVQAAIKFDEAVATAGLEFVAPTSIIFEGAQGLALDQDRGEFPHVTRSNTGLTNVVPIARALGLELDVIYVSRSYLTKHGAGPLPNEYVPDPIPGDDTNIIHPYQGVLRFGRLNVADMQKRIAVDVAEARAKGGTISRITLALTCLDHVPEPNIFERDIKISHRSAGPSRSDIIAQ